MRQGLYLFKESGIIMALKAGIPLYVKVYSSLLKRLKQNNNYKI